MKHLISHLLLSTLFLFSIAVARETPTIAPGGRFIFVGDSITGHHGMGLPNFWIYRVADALKATYPGATPTVVSLGASGISLSGWLKMASQAVPQQDRPCDIKEFFVGKELDSPADAIIILLGANDLAAPYVFDQEKDLAKWEQDYRDLIAFLKTRNHPRAIALATLIPMTEDSQSARNRMVDKLNAIVARLAAEQHLLLIPTNEVFWDMLHQARQRKPDAHIVPDSVHPGGVLGHAALALAVLRGLGFDAAAKQVQENALHEALTKLEGTKPGISWTITPVTNASAAPLDRNFRIEWWLTRAPSAGGAPIDMRLNAPPGWKVSSQAPTAAHGEFLVEPKDFHLYNHLDLVATLPDKTLLRQDVQLPAPWRICTGFHSSKRWGFSAPGFEKRASANPADDRISAGEDVARITLDDGKIPEWHYFLPSVNYSAGPVSGSIDFFSIADPHPFDTGYAMRYLYSEKDRPVRLDLSSRIFAGSIDLTIWMNGEKCYSDVITAAPKKQATATTRLAKGWNTLWVKSAHTTFQWQQVVELKGADGNDGIEDVVVSLEKR